MSNVTVRVLKDLEAKIHAEFLVKNAEARDQEWLTLDAKISKDPERFLRESLTMDTKSGRQGCYDTYLWPVHHSRSRHTYSWLVSMGEYPGYGDPNRWIVLATSQDALAAKVDEVQIQEAGRRDHEAKKRREAEQQPEAHMQAKHQKFSYAEILDFKFIRFFRSIAVFQNSSQRFSIDSFQ
jgi:hypothetical protein